MIVGGPQRSWTWAALGVFSGLSTIALVYASQLGTSGASSPGLVLDLHRRWPAFLVLDGLPLLLGWIGWLAGELRASEQALAETRAVIGPLADGAVARTLLDPVLVVDADGRIVAVNPAASALLEAENLVGTPLREVLPELDQGHPASTERLTRSGRLIGVVWHLAARRPDGSTLMTRVSCGPASGHRVVYVLSPETGSPHADPAWDDRAIRERDEARSDARAKSVFLAGFTRELRARLSRVEADAVHGLPVARALRSALDLVDDVTDLGRIESGRLAVVVDAVQLAPILDAVVARTQPLAEARGNSLVSRVPRQLAVRADPVRLEQILVDLVENACRATSRGAIEIVADRDRDDGNVHRIDVVDTGVGMLPDQTEHLFDDPGRGDTGARKRFGGVGLVLGRQLLEWMGGTIAVESAFGVGSTFTVRLPAAADLSERAELVFAGPRRPLVIVDRQPEPVRTLMRDRLARCGIRPVIWHDGELDELAGLDARAIAIDLDVGDALLAEILATPAFVGIPLLAATSIVHDRARTLPDGVAALLDSPFDPHELVPALLLAERTIRGCVLVASGDGGKALRDALVGASWTVLMVADLEAAVEAVVRRPAALLVLVDIERSRELPATLVRVPTVFLASGGDPQHQVDAIATCT